MQHAITAMLHMLDQQPSPHCYDTVRFVLPPSVQVQLHSRHPMCSVLTGSAEPKSAGVRQEHGAAAAGVLTQHC